LGMNYGLWPYYVDGNRALVRAIIIAGSAVSFYQVNKAFQVWQEIPSSSADNLELVNAIGNRAWTVITSGSIILSPIILHGLVITYANTIHQTNSCNGINKNEMCSTAAVISKLGVCFMFIGSSYCLWTAKQFI